MEFLEHDNVVHLPHPFYDSTLCGDALEGNAVRGYGDNVEFELGMGPCKEVLPQKVTCKTCLAMAKLCKSVPAKFLK